MIGDAGLTFPIGDAQALARCLRRVLQSDNFSEQMGARAISRASSFSLPNAWSMTISCYIASCLAWSPTMTSALDSLVGSER